MAVDSKYMYRVVYAKTDKSMNYNYNSGKIQVKNLVPK